MVIINRDLKLLSKYRNKNSITFYIYSAPEESDEDFNTRVTSLIDEAEKEAEQHESREVRMLVPKLKEVKEHILGDYVSMRGQTFCVFISPDFTIYIELPVHIKEISRVGQTLYLTPLFISLEQFKRYAVLVFGRNKARIFNYYLGKITEEEYMFHDYVVPNINPSASSWKTLEEKSVAHKIENTYQKHLKEVSQRLFDYFKNNGFEKLIIASHEDARNAIKKHLHSYLLENLVGEFAADVDQNVKDIKDKADETVLRYRKNLEIDKIKGLKEQISTQAVVGIDETLGALMNNNVLELVINNSGLNLKGYSCPDGHYMAKENTQSGKCPMCSKKLEEKAFFEDDITEQAFLHGSRIFHITQCMDDFDEYKVGAFLRHR
jgi:rubrerythrin